MSDEFVTRFPYSADDYVAAFMEGGPPYRLMRWMAWSCGAIIIGTVVLPAFIFGLDDSRVMTRENMATLPLGVFFLFAPTLIYSLELRRQRQLTGSMETRRFSPEGFSTTAEGPLTPWALITRVVETKDAFLVTDAASRIPSYLPKSALGSEGLARLRNILSDRERLARTKVKLLQIPSQL